MLAFINNYYKIEQPKYYEINSKIMKYNYRINFLRLALILCLGGLMGLPGAFGQGLKNNTTYVVNGAQDLVAPVDTFANLTGSAAGPFYGAMTYLNQFGMDINQTATGPVVFLLSAGYNPVEPTLINIGQTTGAGGWPNMFWNANSPIVIKPALGQNFTITSSAAVGGNQALVRFNGAWYANIDGEGIPGQRNLTFSISNNTQTTARVIDIMPTSGQRVQGISVKNCNIVGGSNATTVFTFAGVYLGGVTASANAAIGQNQNITIENNYIIAAQNGVYIRGLANVANNQTRNVTINKNIIGGYTNPVNATATPAIGGANGSGIYVNAVANSTIHENSIKNVVATSANFRGIFLNHEGGVAGLSVDSNIQVTSNEITNISITASGGVTGIRVSLGTHTTPRRLLIANNSISKLTSINAQNVVNGFGYPVGILIDNTSANVGAEVFFNSIFLSGSSLPANSMSACFATGPTTTGGIIMMNNSFANSMGRVASNNTSYQVFNLLLTGGYPFTFSSFNNYYTTTFDGGIAYISRVGTRDFVSLKNYQLFSRSDSTSYSLIPPFKNDSDLTVNTGVSHRNFNTGVSLPQFFNFYPSIFNAINFKVAVDRFGTPRNNMGRFTAIGAHLWNGDSSNNIASLTGPRVYPINGFTSRPTILNLNGSFATVAEAIDYLNHYGITGSGNIVLEIQPGYNGETAAIPAVIDFPGASVGTPVTLRTADNFSTTVSMPNVQAINNAAVLRFIGARHMSVSGGSNNGLTFSIPANANNINTRVIAITPIDTNSTAITIRNCNLIGNSTTATINTSYGIYVGNALTAPALFTVNNTNAIQFISNRIVAVRTGIAFLATNTGTVGSSDHLIKSNIIGGEIPVGTAVPTTFIGGSANQAGILVRGLRSTVIDSNVIRNCIPTSNVSNGFMGIQLDEPANNTLGSVEVSRNLIYNLVTVSGTFCTGIRVTLQGVVPAAPLPARSVYLVNNYIGKIIGNGTGTNFSNLNPSGIMVEAAAALTNCGVAMAHNTVHLSGTGLGANNSSSAAVFLNGNVRGGVELVNNLLVNRLNRTSPTGNRYAVLLGHTTTPFTTATLLPFNINSNNYFCFGTGSNFIGGVNNGTVNRANINDWRTFTSTGFPGMDGNSFSWPTVFLNDTTPHISLIDGGLVPGGASIISGLCIDLYGNPRYLCSGGSTTVLRWVGALENGLPYPALQGNVTYPINGVDDPPTPFRPASGSFKTVRAAINYLNSQGVDDPNFGGSRTVRLEIQQGYVGETDTFLTPITVLDYPRMAVTRPVVLGIANGRNDTIQMKRLVNAIFNGNNSMIRIAGSRFFTIDGNNGAGRGITILLPSNFTASTNRVVDFISGVNTVVSTNASTQNNAIRNCNIVGISTPTAIQTFAGVYFGGLVGPSSAIVGSNSNNNVDNNFIGATQYGVYLRGGTAVADFDFNNAITNNIIGGDIAPGGSVNTNYFGGITSAAGIYVLSQINADIVGNTIKNNIQSFATPRGIEIGVIAANTPTMSSFVNISRNTIRNIGTTLTGGAYGVFLDFGNSNNNVDRNIVIDNNMISGIFSGGSSRIGATFAGNPYGVYLNATANIGSAPNNNVGVRLLFNSINLGQGNSLTVANAISACVGIPTFISNGVSMENNLFQNRLGAATVAANNYAVAVGGATEPFVTSNFNNYFAANQGTAVAANMASNVSGTTPVNYNQWFEIMSFTRQDTMSLTSPVPFTNDNNLFIPANTTTNLFQSGRPVMGYSLDINQNPRNFFTPSMGAHEFSGTYLDNIAPRVFNVTDPTLCQAGTILLNFNIYDNFLVGDTLYYKINGGSVQSVQASISGNTFRQYAIPPQASGTIIEYRVVAVDYPTPPNTGIYPTGKIWDTVSTGIKVFPYTNGFEGVNNPVWASKSTNGNGNWEIGVLGSNLNPPQAARSGIRSAIFRSSTMTAGSSARLISPCLDLSGLTSPTLRFYISQNSDLNTKRDSIQISVSYGNDVWSNPLKGVERVNLDFPLPGYRMIEVCLAEHRQDGIRISFEGFSSGNGQNIQIDDIMIYDDAQKQTFTPKNINHCFRDSIQITVANSDARYVYRAFQLGTGFTLGEKGGLDQTIQMGVNVPTNADTLRFAVEANNLSSAANFTGFGGGLTVCRNVMPDTIVAVINRYTTNPLIQPGLPFNGSFNFGTSNNPDGSKVGDTITYSIIPPSFYTNADFGSLWSITQINAYREGSLLPLTNFTYVPPTPSANGFVRYISQAAYLDSNIVFNFGFRLNGSNCDTTVTRVLRIVTPATACFTITPSTNLCARNPIQFSGVCSNPKPANGFPYTFTYNYGDGTFAFEEVPQPKLYQNPGTYTVRYTITDRFGLSSQQVQQITILPSPVIDFTVTNPCATDSTVFTPSTQPAGSQFLWSFHNFTSQNREVAKFNYSKFDTAYNVRVRVTNTSGCFTDASKSVYIFAKPTASFSTQAHCRGLVVPITNSSTIPTGIMGYTWDWGNGQTSLSANPTYRYPTSGTFNATLKVSSAFGCVDSMVRAVTIYDKPNVGFTLNKACVGEATQFTNTTTFTGGQANVNYVWNFGDNRGTSTEINPAYPFTSVTDFQPVRVTLLAVDKLNGCRDSVGQNIEIDYKPIAQWGMPDFGCENNPINFLNTSYTLDGEAFNCEWIWGDTKKDTICNLSSRVYTQHGSYNPMLIITTMSGCKDTVTKNLVINLPEDNVLTEDTINTYLYPYCKNMRRLTASVVDAEYYNWKMGDKFNSTRLGKVTEFVFTDKGTYNVECVIKDKSGCIVTDSIKVIVECAVGTEETLAANYSLTAYPNPFNNGTNLSFELPSNSDVKVTTLDMLGRTIKVNSLGRISGGKHQFYLDDTYFGASGAYMIKVEIDGKSVYQQMIKQ
jgi:hypothetical protein